MSYIPHTPQDIDEMLQVIGVSHIDDLFQQIPEELRFKKALNVPPSSSEMELAEEMVQKSQKNKNLTGQISFLGAGAYDHYVPAVVDGLSLRGEFFSAYTPYQAEASQGMLQAFFEFQTLICRLTDMDSANASMYDGASALAESVIMAMNITKRSKVLLSPTLHPEYIEVVHTYLENLPNIQIEKFQYLDNGATDLKYLEKQIDEMVACVVFQTPNFFGVLEEGKKITELAHQKGALAISSIVDPFSLSMISSPGEDEVDIACGEAQCLGNPLCFGGPSLGFLALKNKYLRKMPGRVVGETVDIEGKRAFVLTLQTREQHIRREKATSNICTNQALLALRTTIYLSAIGKKGFQQLGELCFQKAHYLAKKIWKIPGFKRAYSEPFFREFVVECPVSPSKIVEQLTSKNILPGLPLKTFSSSKENHLLIGVTEKHSKKHLDTFVTELQKLNLS